MLENALTRYWTCFSKEVLFVTCKAQNRKHMRTEVKKNVLYLQKTDDYLKKGEGVDQKICNKNSCMAVAASTTLR